MSRTATRSDRVHRACAAFRDLRAAVPAIALVLLAVLGATPALGSTSARPVRIADATPPIATNPVWTWVRTAAASLERGGIPVRTYPASSLGNEAERLEQVALGLVQINVASGLDVLHYSPTLRSLRLPFLVENLEQLDCLLHRSDFLSRVNAETVPYGVEVLDVAVVGGMAGLFVRAGGVRGPEDLRGRRIRALDRIQVLTVQSWGASPVNVPWEEVQSALQTGIVDGYVNPPGVAVQFRHDRQLRQFVDLRVSSGIRFVTVSSRWRAGLEPAARAALDAALAEARAANRAHARSRASQDRARLAELGLEITVPDAALRARYVALTRPLYDTLVPAPVHRRVAADLASCRSGDAG